MKVTDTRSAPRRAPLDRGRVLAAAVSRADAEGLAVISMRALAAQLGVVPMALYKHVTDKGDLIGGMIDTVVGGYSDIAPALTGTAAVRARLDGARTALAAHPWLRDAIDTRTAPTPAALAHMNAVAGDLRAGGYSVDLAHYAMHALGHRIWGYSPEAFEKPSARRAPDPPADPEVLAAMANAFPHVAAIASDAATRNPAGACEPDAEFDFTLTLLLDAFERLHATGWESRPSR